MALGTSVGLESSMALGTSVGFVGQEIEGQILSDDVQAEMAFGMENEGLPREIMVRRIAELSQFFAMESWLHVPTAELSGGQKALLNLVSVLAMAPRLLLLDEPTAELDPVARTNFVHGLFRVKNDFGITIVVATHEPEVFADYADLLFELRDHSVQSRSLEELRRHAHKPLILETFEQESPNRSLFDEEVHGKKRRSDDAVPLSSALSLKDVFFAYPDGEDDVLKGLSLNVACGKIHAIVGGNGGGKTTLLRLMAKIAKPGRGKVVNNLTDNQCYLPQDPEALFVCDSVEEELFEWSVKPLSDILRAASREESSFLEPWLDGNLRKRHPFDLSKGERQKLALAKLLTASPQLLFMDEPTKSLDSVGKALVGRLMRSLADRGMTIVMASHDLSFVACVADRISLLFDGQIAVTQAPEEFCREALFYRPYEDGFTKIWSEAHEDGFKKI